jgi:hypothetical protein
MTQKYSPEKQQELMETSLRNVRALVDQIEEEEKVERGERRRIFAILGVAVLALIVVVGYIVLRQPSGTSVIVTPSSPPPKPAPPK